MIHSSVQKKNSGNSCAWRMPHGIRIVLDAVFNHCSMQMQQFCDVMEKGAESPYYDWFLIDGAYRFQAVRIMNVLQSVPMCQSLTRQTPRYRNI